MYRGFARRYGVEQVLSTAIFNPTSALMNFISFWRSSKDQPFTEHERQLKQFLMPHLILTYSNNTFMHMRRAGAPPQELPFVAAICDRKGILSQVEDEFITQLSMEWPGWTGPELPAELRTALFRRTKASYKGTALVINATPINDLIFLQARRPNKSDDLTRSERQIANLLIKGQTHKQISEGLSVAPSTVRNHMHAIYKKLGARNKAQFVKTYLDEMES
jgi:DNA-binding CsgD family transcriptional regulator